jgi:hypothetical protein
LTSWPGLGPVKRWSNTGQTLVTVGCAPGAPAADAGKAEATGQILVKHRSNTGQTLVKHRSNTGQTLVKHWSNTGQALVKRWSNTGQALIKRWSNAGEGLSIRPEAGQHLDDDQHLSSI